MSKSPPEVASPCNSICTLNAADVCVGCGRSRQEIAAWSQAPEPVRRRIVDAAARRLESIAAAESSRQNA